MKKNSKTARISNLEKRRAYLSNVLPKVRKLVSEFDLAAVQAAVKTLYSERTAEKELRAAEAKVEALKRKLS